MSLALGPEGDVLGIEVARGDHWAIRQLAPAQSIGRGKGVEACLLRPGEGLVALVGRDARAIVEQRAEVVREGGLASEDDVVGPLAPDGEEIEIRPGPGDAVDRFGDTGRFTITTVGPRLRQSTIVEAVTAAIPDDGAVSGEGAFPGPVEAQDLPGVDRLLQLEGDPIRPFDEGAIDKELEARTKIERSRLGGDGQRQPGPDKKDDRNQPSPHRPLHQASSRRRSWATRRGSSAARSRRSSGSRSIW